jgi:hypothetical protein
LNDRIQAAIEVKKIEEQNPNLEIEVRNSYGKNLGLFSHIELRSSASPKSRRMIWRRWA